MWRERTFRIKFPHSPARVQVYVSPIHTSFPIIVEPIWFAVAPFCEYPCRDCTPKPYRVRASRRTVGRYREVGRSTVTAGCTVEAYANRLDFARMAFLFVVKNGACEPRFSRRPTSTTRLTVYTIFHRDSRHTRCPEPVSRDVTNHRSLLELHLYTILLFLPFVTRL